MQIEHVALWTQDLERSRQFYETYFNGKANQKYVNSTKQFESYFLTFESGARLELMQRPDLENHSGEYMMGWAHIAVSIGNKDAVHALTERLRQDGYTIKSEPRTTGDGYYESVVLDPDGNHIEITI